MTKLVPSHTISNCYECIEYKCDAPSNLYYCRKMQRSTNNVGIPSWCPLDDAVDESSHGDLTDEDINRINETARRIKDAKNVRDQRYG